MPLPGAEQLQGLYAATLSAIEGREAMQSALRDGAVQRYHRARREHPEATHADALIAVRRQLNTLSAERQRLMGTPTRNPMRRDLEIEQIGEAMTQIASGTLLFVQEADDGS